MDIGKAPSSLVYATQLLSPMSGHELDPLSTNQKPATSDEVSQQRVLSSSGVAVADGLCYFRSIVLF